MAGAIDGPGFAVSAHYTTTPSPLIVRVKMPGLGHFLKKKRTREDKGDHHGKEPTSPVATSHQAQQPQAQAQTQQATGAGAAAAATGGQTTATNAAQSGGAPAPAQGQNNPHVTVNQPTTSTSPNQPQDPSNATGASSLVNANASQNDGAAANLNTEPFAQNQSNSSLGPAAVPVQSASPGTDPTLSQSQQPAVRPPPSSASPVNTTVMQPDIQSQQQQQHGQVQTQQPSGHQQNASTSSTARVTKGKYTLNDFDILRTLGTGSFGRVHLVQSKHNQRFYAIKVLKKAQVVKMKQVEHTNDERRMLSDVKHPFLITLWGTFSDWKSLYMVMDFVEGGELFSLLRKSGVSPSVAAV